VNEAWGTLGARPEINDGNEGFVLRAQEIGEFDSPFFGG
jgi:hypothetical protein